jgi:hypothetical protein
MQAYPGLNKMMPVNVTAVNSLGSKAIKLNPAIAQAAGIAPSQAKAGAVVIPQVTSLAAGPNLTLDDIFHAMPEGISYKTQVADMNRPDGPLGILYDFKKTLLGMYNVSDEGKNLLIVSGRGGTGKTYTIEETLASRGLSEGTHYKTITGASVRRASSSQDIGSHITRLLILRKRPLREVPHNLRVHFVFSSTNRPTSSRTVPLPPKQTYFNPAISRSFFGKASLSI